MDFSALNELIDAADIFEDSKETQKFKGEQLHKHKSAVPYKPRKAERRAKDNPDNPFDGW
jgi:hypothetical protein